MSTDNQETNCPVMARTAISGGTQLTLNIGDTKSFLTEKAAGGVPAERREQRDRGQLQLAAHSSPSSTASAAQEEGRLIFGKSACLC